MTRNYSAKRSARQLAAATGQKYTQARRSTRADVERSLSEPVHCPNCGAGPGRQAPVYAGHGEGQPYATGAFRCEVCLANYSPAEDGSWSIDRWELRGAPSAPALWADSEGQFVLPDGSRGEPRL